MILLVILVVVLVLVLVVVVVVVVVFVVVVVVFVVFVVVVFVVDVFVVVKAVVVVLVVIVVAVLLLLEELWLRPHQSGGRSGTLYLNRMLENRRTSSYCFIHQCPSIQEQAKRHPQGAAVLVFTLWRKWKKPKEKVFFSEPPGQIFTNKQKMTSSFYFILFEEIYDLRSIIPVYTTKWHNYHNCTNCKKQLKKFLTLERVIFLWSPFLCFSLRRSALMTGTWSTKTTVCSSTSSTASKMAGDSSVLVVFFLFFKTWRFGDVLLAGSMLKFFVWDGFTLFY